MARKLRRVLKWTAIVIAVVVIVPVIALTIGYFRSDNDCAARSATVPQTPMKAVVYCDYGSPDVLSLQAIEKPVPGPDQVLVKVRAASANPLDWHYMRGTPAIMRLDGGLRRPKVTRLGVDLSGTVEAVGANVNKFKPGDEVFGAGSGAFAEYATASQLGLTMKPPNLTFEEAAAVPIAALTALQALRDKGKVSAGQRVLINGASGGVGTFAVQIAKSLGAHVTGVCSTRNVELVRSIGADNVIDYTKQDFTAGAERYDVIIDMVGNHRLSAYRHVLKPTGTYVMVGGPSGRWVAPMDRVASMAVVSRFGSEKFVFLMAKVRRSDLDTLRDLLEAGRIKPVIDRRYPLTEIAEAIRYLETGRARGKVVINVAP